MITIKSTGYSHFLMLIHRFLRQFIRRKPAIIILLIVGVGLVPYSAHAFDVRLGTGPAGTFSYFTGRTLCRAINSQLVTINCQVVSTVDDVDNLTNIRGGSLDIGLVDSRMLVNAVNKSGYFQYLDIGYENIRTITPLYEMPVALVVRDDADIDTLDDLRGKRLNAGTPRGLRSMAVDTLMKAKNWSKDDFKLFGELPPSQSQDTMAFCHGTMQAMVHIGVHPDSSLAQLFKLCKAKLIPMDDGDIQKLIENHPALWKSGILANTYPSQPNQVATFGTRTILVTSEDLDDETVYQILDVIYSSQKKLAGAHVALSLFPPTEAKKEMPGIPFHSGADKYFSEH